MADPQQAQPTPSATPPPTQFGGDNALADKIRAKYPGAYDDMSDAQLAAAVVQKYPEYKDLSLPYDMKVKRGDQWVPVRSETATPDERTHGIEYHPPDVYSAHNTYEGIKVGVMGATAPLALEASVPQLIGGLVGGGVGSYGGQKIAKATGAGETGQEVAGDVGGVLGGVAGGGFSDWAVTKAHAIFEALPAEIQQALVKHAVSTVSPRAGNGIKLWNTLKSALADKPNVKPIAELDATAENEDYAGEKPPKRYRWDAHDATGPSENKPFAGGMDEPRATPRTAAPPTPPASAWPMPPSSAQPPVAPGAAGSMVDSVVAPRTIVTDPATGRPGFSDAAQSSSTPSATGDLLTRLRAVANKIERDEAAPKKTPAPKTKTTVPRVPTSEEDMLDLLHQSVQRMSGTQ